MIRRTNETIEIFLDFLKFNLLFHLGTWGNLKVFWYNISGRKVTTKRSVLFSANIVHASTPASSKMVAAVWVGKRNETLILSHSVLLYNELSQLLKIQLIFRKKVRYCLQKLWLFIQKWIVINIWRNTFKNIYVMNKLYKIYLIYPRLHIIIVSKRQEMLLEVTIRLNFRFIYNMHSLWIYVFIQKLN